MLFTSPTVLLRQASLTPLYTAQWWLPSLACLGTQPVPPSIARGYAKKRNAGEDEDEEGLDLFLEQLRPKIKPKRTFTPEQLAERAARAKEFSKHMIHWKMVQQANLQRKAEIMAAAFEALPKHLQRAASKPDYAPFPTDRPMFGETPPIVWYREWKRKQQASKSARR